MRFHAVGIASVSLSLAACASGSPKPGFEEIDAALPDKLDARNPDPVIVDHVCAGQQLDRQFAFRIVHIPLFEVGVL